MTQKGRRLKLTPERIDIICQVLQQTGSYKLAHEAADISNETFYRYMREIPSFKERIEAIQETRAKEVSQQAFNRIEAAEDWLDKLFKGELKKHTTKTTTFPDGSQRIEETTEDVIPAHYHLERVLGPIKPSQSNTDNKIEIIEDNDPGEQDEEVEESYEASTLL